MHPEPVDRGPKVMCCVAIERDRLLGPAPTPAEFAKRQALEATGGLSEQFLEHVDRQRVLLEGGSKIFDDPQPKLFEPASPAGEFRAT